jgi:CheY-like chemotaxis protein
VFLLMAEPFAFQYAFWIALTSVGLTGLAHKLFHWSLKLTTHMLLIQSYVLVMYCVWVSGGLFSSAIIWLIILPVPAMFMLGLRDSLLWIAVVLLSVSSFVPLTEYGWLPVSYVYSQQHLLWSFGNYTFTAISLVSGLLVYKRIYTNQLNEINQRNDELMTNRAALIQAEPVDDDSGITRLQSFAVRFLVVDDSAVNRMLACQVVKSHWPQAVWVQAGNGQEALDALRQESFDMVLMDMLMPVMDGIEATQRLRTEWPAPQRDVPVLALTANVNTEDHQRCMDVGVNALVLKPFERLKLCALIEEQLLLSPAFMQRLNQAKH